MPRTRRSGTGAPSRRSRPAASGNGRPSGGRPARGRAAGSKPARGGTSRGRSAGAPSTRATSAAGKRGGRPAPKKSSRPGKAERARERERRSRTGRGPARPAERREKTAVTPVPALVTIVPDTSDEPTARLTLQRNQDRRVRGGHPWIFSNEVEGVEGDVRDGCLVDVVDSRGAYLGRAYYNRHSLICARMLTRGRDAINAAFFAQRLERAAAFRERAYPGAAALRLVYGEADQLPGLVIDRYGDVLAVQVLTLGLEVRLDAIREAIEHAFSPAGVVRVADSPLRTLEGLALERTVWWGDVPERVEVDMEGFTVEADLMHGQKTGLFLDQRENRGRAERYASGRRVLDLFCYQGEWALHLARGGASHVLAIDSSEPALAAARRNLERNGYEATVELRKGDAFNEVRALERTGARFDMVVLDPPAFVKSKKHLAAGAKAYREANRAAMAMLTDGGILVTCSCSHHLDDALFRQVLLEAAKAARRPFRVLEWAGEAADHPQLLAVPETHYLKCAVLQVV